jgi:hypothetical protein
MEAVGTPGLRALEADAGASHGQLRIEVETGAAAAEAKREDGDLAG